MIAAVKRVFSHKKTLKTIAFTSFATVVGYGVMHTLQTPNIVQPAQDSNPIFTEVRPMQVLETAQKQKKTTVQVQPLQNQPQQLQKQKVVQAEVNTQMTENTQSEQNQQKQTSVSLGKPVLRLQDVPQWSLKTAWEPQDLVLIVADIGYNQKFQEKLIKDINKVIVGQHSVKIFRTDTSQNKVKAEIERTHKTKVKDQTVFFIKNAYDKTISNIDFDMYMQHPLILETYLKKLSIYNQESIENLTSNMTKMKPNQSFLFYLYDKEQPQIKVKQRFMTAKYIQLQMLFNHLPGVSLQVVEKNAAVEAGLVPAAQAKVNSLHLFRKHNIFTPFQPNFYLRGQSELQTPFYRLTNIALFAKSSNAMMIPSYLSGLEIFDSAQIASRYVCTLTIDRNRISDQKFTKLLQIFGQLKREDMFPEVSFQLRADKVAYSGSGGSQNKEWQITLGNLEQMDNQSRVFSVKNRKQLQELGYSQNTFLKQSNQYLYEHSVADYQLLKDFINQATSGEHEKYYRSEKKQALSNIKKLVGKNFHQTIKTGNHLIYQYSEQCPTCQKISPIISGFADIVSKVPDLGLNDLSFGRIDASKNRIESIPATPYIPNIYYFKPEWKGAAARFPIDSLSAGVFSLFEFCTINSQIQTVDWSNIERAVSQHNKAKSQPSQ